VIIVGLLNIWHSCPLVRRLAYQWFDSCTYCMKGRSLGRRRYRPIVSSDGSSWFGFSANTASTRLSGITWSRRLEWTGPESSWTQPSIRVSQVSVDVVWACLDCSSQFKNTTSRGPHTRVLCFSVQLCVFRC